MYDLEFKACTSAWVLLVFAKTPF
uniref:Uncharacterized protein n=1 Tax=Arundo donax TaxID=35708 RepID=A0A0A9BWC2_ARUDO